MKNQPLHPHTAVINLKQKNLSKQKKYQALRWLEQRFPHLFDNRTSIKPLKLGIMKDIISHAKEAAADGISLSKLREALALHTRKLEYLACLKAREVRVDLEGNPTTQVSTEDAKSAAEKIKRRIEKSAKNQPHTPQKQNIQPYPHTIEIPYTAPEIPERKVLITHKTTRQYDANTVARLKEKLGLKQQMLKEK